ncbi:hypothetical protein FAM09_16535 [Niastella caeni]|uniref:Uncharacterized protein n=1 Tax=Niastella caeni TaxID=2569763 RepID=A0A4S8HS38_9BACT|nr:hypothetical protein [Niastella caeni]THU38283.1 hypothetical protein FAM09_16535 [Niastella caeni]
MEKTTFAEVEKQLMAHLSAANLSKEHLSHVSGSISKTYAAGLRIVDWWIYGIPAFERIVVQGQLPIEAAGTFQELIANKMFKEIRIFRKGIPVPHFFQVDLTIEKITEQMPKI